MIFNPGPLDLESSVLIFYKFKLKNIVATHKIIHNKVFPKQLGHCQNLIIVFVKQRYTRHGFLGIL